VQERKYEKKLVIRWPGNIKRSLGVECSVRDSFDEGREKKGTRMQKSQDQKACSSTAFPDRGTKRQGKKSKRGDSDMYMRETRQIKRSRPKRG